MVALGSFYGGFIFCTTLVVANVIFNSPSLVKLPKVAILKELIFYTISVIVVVIFGLMKTAGMTFVIVYFSIYFCYIVLSVIADRMSTEEPVDELE